MKSQRSFPSATVTAKAERSIKAGHPWVYDAEIKSIDGEYENGGLIDVRSEKALIWAPAFLVKKARYASACFPQMQTTTLAKAFSQDASAMQ